MPQHEPQVGELLAQGRLLESDVAIDELYALGKSGYDIVGGAPVDIVLRSLEPPVVGRRQEAAGIRRVERLGVVVVIALCEIRPGNQVCGTRVQSGSVDADVVTRQQRKPRPPLDVVLKSRQQSGRPWSQYVSLDVDGGAGDYLYIVASSPARIQLIGITAVGFRGEAGPDRGHDPAHAHVAFEVDHAIGGERKDGCRAVDAQGFSLWDRVARVAGELVGTGIEKGRAVGLLPVVQDTADISQIVADDFDIRASRFAVEDDFGARGRVVTPGLIPPIGGAGDGAARAVVAQVAAGQMDAYGSDPVVAKQVEIVIVLNVTDVVDVDPTAVGPRPAVGAGVVEAAPGTLLPDTRVTRECEIAVDLRVGRVDVGRSDAWKRQWLRLQPLPHSAGDGREICQQASAVGNGRACRALPGVGISIEVAALFRREGAEYIGEGQVCVYHQRQPGWHRSERVRRSRQKLAGDFDPVIAKNQEVPPRACLSGNHSVDAVEVNPGIAV